ncbi:MAG: S8/S53 family peptidase [Candidatus Hatepunaea meridiana]|nr:S8/S53 family peptidase [Candidatus Hatepunaea meridiana]
MAGRWLRELQERLPNELCQVLTHDTTNERLTPETTSKLCQNATTECIKSLESGSNVFHKYVMLLLATGVLFLSHLFASIAFSGDNNHVPYWVYFTDKGYKSETEISQALNVARLDLSPRALNRRERLNKNNLLDINDLRVNPQYIDTINKMLELRQVLTPDATLNSPDATWNSPRVVSRWLNAASYNFYPHQIKEISNLSFVKCIKPVRRFIRDQPIDTLIPESAHPDPLPRRDHEFNYGNSYRQNAFLNVPELHDRNYLGQGVLVGLTDTGFNNLDHNCFQELDVVASWDFVNDDDDVGDGDDNGNGDHGTRTLSVIAGFDPRRLIGIAPGASFVLAKTESTEWEREVEEDYWIAAIEWMDELGVEVVSSSLSYSDWYEYEDMDGETSPITIVADRAVSVGMVVVNSMGNSGRSRYPDNKMGAPADGYNVFAIGATNRDSTRAIFSSFGPTYDNRIKPDFTTFGVSVRAASPDNDNNYSINSGTSFSAPAIAGLCALLIQIDPYLTPLALRDLLRDVSHNAEEPDTLSGWGIPDGLAAYERLQPENTSLIIPLLQGWNIISQNLIQVVKFTIPEVFDEIVFMGNLRLVRDGFGNFYTPAYDFNNIPDWDVFQGYHVWVIEEDTLTFEGRLIDFTLPIPLEEGWQIVSYLPEFSMTVEDALSSLVGADKLIMVRDEDGHFFIPDRLFNNMDPLIPGRGYQLRLESAGELIYPRRRSDAVNAPLQPDPVVFISPPPSADGMYVLIYAENNILDSDEIGFFDDNNQLIGSGVFNEGRCGVAIWGEEKGVFPVARLYRNKQQDIIEPRIEWIEGPYSYMPNEIAVIQASLNIKKPENQQSSFQISASPNPFNNQITVSYSIPYSSNIKVVVFDLLGRNVAQYTNYSPDTKNGKVTFNTSNLAGGSYIIEIRSNHDMQRLVVKHIK